MNLRTGSEPENANIHGNAEVPDNVKDKDGAMEMMLAKRSTNENRLIFLRTEHSAEIFLLNRKLSCINKTIGLKGLLTLIYLRN